MHAGCGITLKVTCPRWTTGFQSTHQYFEPPATAGQVDRLDTHHGLLEWRRLSDKFERYPKVLRLVCVGPARIAGSTASSSRRPMMRFYQQQHGFYCGVDLHARTMHVCVVDDEGQTRKHVNLPCDGGRFLKLIEPYREQVVVSCECMFSWYWLADLCREEKISFVLGHALYMKAIHGGKTKSDKIDRTMNNQRRRVSSWPNWGNMRRARPGSVFDNLLRPSSRFPRRKNSFNLLPSAIDLDPLALIGDSPPTGVH